MVGTTPTLRGRRLNHTLMEAHVRKRLLAAIVTGMSILVATPGSAQSATSSREFDLSAAAIYDFVLNEGNATSNLGAHFDVAKRFLESDRTSVQGLGEIGFNHFEFDTISHYAGGMRIANRSGSKNVIFGQFLAGVEHASSQTQFLMQPGGGMDFAWKAQYAVRVQLDWRHVFTDVDDHDGFRVGVGLVFPLNR
jgi:hypothetical protein